MSRNVVLVHGLWYGPLSLGLLARRLGRGGLDCHRFGYPTLRRSLATNARALFDFARAIETGTLDFVGHSLGGLVVLRMLDEFSGRLPPGRVVLLGSPVNGSVVARNVAAKGWLRPLVGQARSALATGFDHAPAGRETGIVAGSLRLGVGRIFPGGSRPGDGTVSLDETRLAGAADRLELPVTHTGLVTAPSVATAVEEFLRSGRFGE